MKNAVLEEILNHVLETQGIDLTYNLRAKRERFPDGFRWRYYGKLKLTKGVKAYCYSITKNANNNGRLSPLGVLGKVSVPHTYPV